MRTIKDFPVWTSNNQNYTITINPSSPIRSGWIIGQYRGIYPIGDNWIQYSDGRIVFDKPELIPQYVKDKLYSLVHGINKSGKIKVFCPNLDCFDHLIPFYISPEDLTEGLGEVWCDYCEMPCMAVETKGLLS